MADLYDAQLNGFPLQIEVISDDFEKAIARYEIPYRDGALLEDMGQRARRIRIRCWFWDAADNRTYDEHADFINSLTAQSLFEFVHPTYGPIQGCVETFSVTQDDKQRTAEVEITFVENLRGTTQTIQDYPAQDVQGDCEDAFAANALESIAAFGAECTSFLGAEASAVATSAIDPTLPIPGQFTGLSMSAFAFVEAVSGAITSLNGTLADVQNPSNSLLAATAFPQTLPGLAVQAAAKCCERYTVLREGLAAIPTSWSATISADFSALAARFTANSTGSAAAIRVNTALLPKVIRMQAAAAAALALASIYAADQANWTTAEQAGVDNAFDILGNYAYPDTPSAQLMTTNDLEQTLSDVRGIIEAAIEFARANDVAPSCVASQSSGAGSSISGLTQAALALQVQVENEILERQTLVQVAIARPLPLHLVCLIYGLPYNTAEQLWAVNRGKMRNPNAVSGQIFVYRGGANG